MILKAKFKTDTSMSWKRRSSQLKAVDEAIGAYHKGRPPRNVKPIADALVAWAANKGFKPNGDIDTERDRMTIRQLIADVAAQPGGDACRNLRAAVQAAGPVIAAGDSGEAFNWVQQKSGELDQFKTYACMDASNFRSCIKRGQEDKVLGRVKDSKGSPVPASVVQKGDYSWKSYALRMRFQNVQQFGKQGECTTFGYLAAHVLTNGRDKGPRVELVAHDNGRGSHVYVLVGRVGPHNDGRIPDGWKAVIVDAWAAALGHPCIYKGTGNYPFGGMTTNLELIMERPAS